MPAPVPVPPPGRAEIVTVSLWESRSAIEAFAGQDIEQAVFYPEDDRYLIDRDLTVRHYEVAGPVGRRNTAGPAWPEATPPGPEQHRRFAVTKACCTFVQ